MKIIKRNGAEVTFDIDKIVNAVTKANNAVEEAVRMTPLQIQRISQSVQIACEEMGRSPAVEEIQDLVEKAIMAHGAFEVAKEYITYRYTRNLARQSNTTDDRILSLIESNNEEVKQENANKNPAVNSVQRDYMAGEVSKDITNRILLPREIVQAHEQGIIHFHDADYFAQHMHNCDLVNLEDMLQNGTVISGTMIEKPHSFSTACNIATQIIAQVASNQLCSKGAPTACPHFTQVAGISHFASFSSILLSFPNVYVINLNSKVLPSPDAPVIKVVFSDGSIVILESAKISILLIIFSINSLPQFFLILEKLTIISILPKNLSKHIKQYFKKNCLLCK